MAAKKKGWTVSTNVKANPGSQGTLFQGGSEQMSDRRYPKGYTPERLAEVRPAIMGNPYNIRDRIIGGKHHSTAPQRRDVIDTVARSTVPAEHLQGAQFFPGQHSLSLPGEEAAAGIYKVAQKSISILKGYEKEDTVIHEIGHHVSHQSEQHGGYATPAQQGTEEAHADNYAAEHYRDEKGRQRKVYTYGLGIRTKTRPEEFYAAYDQTREGEHGINSALDRKMDEEQARQQAHMVLPGMPRNRWE
jgi:hypothetical protein